MDNNKAKEIRLIVELEMSLFATTRMFVMPTIFYNLMPKAYCDSINNAFTVNDAGLSITKIDLGSPTGKPLLTVDFIITDIKKSNAFCRKMIADKKVEDYLDDFHKDQQQVDVIINTFHDKLCRGLNEFFTCNKIDLRIKKIKGQESN